MRPTTLSPFSLITVVFRLPSHLLLRGHWGISFHVPQMSLASLQIETFTLPLPGNLRNTEITRNNVSPFSLAAVAIY